MGSSALLKDTHHPDRVANTFPKDDTSLINLDARSYAIG